jgi:hypothetical protein
MEGSDGVGQLVGKSPAMLLGQGWPGVGPRLRLDAAEDHPLTAGILALGDQAGMGDGAGQETQYCRLVPKGAWQAAAIAADYNAGTEPDVVGPAEGRNERLEGIQTGRR